MADGSAQTNCLVYAANGSAVVSNTGNRCHGGAATNEGCVSAGHTGGGSVCVHSFNAGNNVCGGVDGVTADVLNGHLWLSGKHCTA